MKGGTLTTVLNYDESDDIWYLTSPSGAYISDILIYGAANNITFTKGTASVDIAPGAFLNVDTSLQVKTGPVVITGNAGGSSEIIPSNGQSILPVGTMATQAGAETLTNKTLGSGTVIPVTLVLAASDRATAITATDNPKKTIRAPWAFTLTDVKASCRVAPTGASLIVDVNEATTGTSVLATKITIEAGEYTSEDATTQPVIGDSTIANDSLLEIDFDQVGSTIAGGRSSSHIIRDSGASMRKYFFPCLLVTLIIAAALVAMPPIAPAEDVETSWFSGSSSSSSSSSSGGTITHVGSDSYATVGDSTLTMPAGIANGDLMIVSGMSDSATVPPASPATGWTEIASVTADSCWQKMWQRVADTEGATVVFNTNAVAGAYVLTVFEKDAGTWG